MAYVVKNTRNQIVATVNDGAVDNSTSLSMIGRNYVGYGLALNTNFMYLLENFTGTTAPSTPVTGQLWYDGNTNDLKIYNGAGFVQAIKQVANLAASGNLDVTGNANIGNANITGTVRAATANITGAANIGSTLDVVGNITAGNVTGTLLGGTLITASQPNITSVGTLTSLAVTNDLSITAGNLSVSGYISGPSHQNGNSNVSITANANVSVYVAGNTTARAVFTSTGANISGTANITGNANVGNLGTATVIATTANLTTINSGLLQNGNSNVTITANANVSVFVTGNATARAVFTSTGANIAGTANITGNANVGNLGANTVVATTGNITTVNATTANITGNILLGNTTETLSRTVYNSTNFSKIVVRPSFDFNNSGNIGANDGAALSNYVGGVAAYTLNTNPPPYVLNHADSPSTGMMVLGADPLSYSIGSTSNGAVWLTSGNVTGNGVASYLRVGYISNDSQDVYIKAANATVSGNLTVTGNANVGNLGTSGNLSAGYFIGNGSQLTGMASGTSIVNGNSSVSVAANSNVTIAVTAANSYTFATGSFAPSANASVTLGTTTARWSTVYGIASSAQYADLAENYRSDADYEPGTVLQIGGEHEITICNTPFSNRVFGCVSTDPAYLMNDSEKEGIWLPVVLTGRSPIRVAGMVNKGDRLVSAGNGAAMAAGTFGSSYQTEIGRALETKTTEEIATIEAYISTR